MSKAAFILGTFLPPTIGHAQMIQFARMLSSSTHIVLAIRSDEPYREERTAALVDMANHLGGVAVHVHDEDGPEYPEDSPSPEAFWAYWAGVMHDYGFQDGDYLVSSEDYGQTLADKLNGVHMPYDIDRDIMPVHASSIRSYPAHSFKLIAPEFQQYVRQTVTTFGAESTGKTTTALALSKETPEGWYLPEWARPYMERFEPAVTRDVMLNIWHGQAALQRSGAQLRDKRFIFQDTDLFSTLGYARLYPDLLTGPEMHALASEALAFKSDLYLVMSSAIPFEPDPLRFGGDARESSDRFWIDICEEFGLNYVYVNETSEWLRVVVAQQAAYDLWHGVSDKLSYERKGEH